MTRPAEDWGVTIRRIAGGWLFGDVTPGQMPPHAVLPLENPDGHEAAHFLEGLTSVEAYRTVVIGARRARRIALLSSKFGAPATAMTVEVLADLGVRQPDRGGLLRRPRGRRAVRRPRAGIVGVS